MADTPILSSTEVEKKIEALNKSLSSLSTEEAQKQISALEKLISNSKFKDEIKKNLIDSFDKVKKSAKELSDTFQNLKLPDFQKLVGDYVDDWKSVAESSASLLETMVRISVIPQSDFFKTLKGSSDVMNDLNESSIIFNNSIGKLLPEQVRKMITEFSAAEQRVNDMAQGLFSAAAATGRLSEYASEVGPSFSFDKIEEKMTTLNDMTLEIANANNINISKVRDFAGTLLKTIPNALDQVNNVTISSGKNMNSLDAAMKVAAGTGQNMSEVTSYMTAGYLKFNLSTQKSLENFSAMSAASDKLNLPFSNVKSYIDTAADSFMYFTDNTQSLINVMGKLAPAFQAAKLSPQAITELTSTMVRNINGMALAQRSFLSMQTGGPGGLRGGYEIELLKAQGKFEEIQKKTEQALRKQFGGQVVTLQEAARDEGAARQLAKQVQLVTTGPTKVVDTEAQAYKLFEAMRAGTGGAAMETGAEALQNSVERGAKIAENQASTLTTIANWTEYTAMNTAIMAKNSSKDVSNLVTSFTKKSVETGSDKLKELGINVEGLNKILGTKSEEYSKEAARRTFYREGSPFATNQLTLKRQRELSAPLIDENVKSQVEKKSAMQELEAEFAPGINIPTLEAKTPEPMSYEEFLAKSSIFKTPQEMPGVGAPMSSSHQITINVQGPDNKAVETLVVKLINGQMQLDRQASILGAAQVPNPTPKQ